MKCWKCHKEQPDPSSGKLSFRAECSFCGAALHCCKNCIFYAPGKPNDCLVPNTEFIRDREAPNFCEEFKMGTGKESPRAIDPKDVAKRLFKDE